MPAFPDLAMLILVKVTDLGLEGKMSLGNDATFLSFLFSLAWTAPGSE